MDQKKEFLSKEKYDELQAELDNLKKVKRKEVAESLEAAKALGDLSENAEYHAARDLQAEIEDRISRLESVLMSAQIVSDGKHDVVKIGATVDLKGDGNLKNVTYKIVGFEEADVAAGKISINSPLGKAILGHKKGETVILKTPKGEVSYKIVKVY